VEIEERNNKAVNMDIDLELLDPKVDTLLLEEDISKEEEVITRT
jgi:hypothetical protein